MYDAPNMKSRPRAGDTLNSTTTRATRQFFIQLWALLCVLDGHSGRLLDELYAIDIAQLEKRIDETHPGLSNREIQRRATILAAMIEGLMVVRGSHSAQEREMARLMERAFAVGVRIAHGLTNEQEAD